jgi:hypothetical protein
LHCYGLQAINVNAANPNYSSQDGVLFSKDMTILEACPCGKDDAYTVPNMVTTIGFSAFEGCKKLQRIELPSSIDSIADYAFYLCPNLTELICRATVPSKTEGTCVFADSASTYLTIYVPYESLDSYRNSPYAWSTIQNIQPLSQYTGIQAAPLTDRAAACPEFYGIDGRRSVDARQSLTPGIYVEHQGRESRKVLIR